jgi:hypothetical protein
MQNEFKFAETGEFSSESAAQDSQNVATALNEDLVLAQLKDRDLPADTIEGISQNAALMKSRKVRMELAAHPRTPRRIAFRIIRELYTFDLMRFALMPAAAADLKQVADQALLTRLPSITLGERISLARRGSGTIAGALLRDKEEQVWQAALENPRLSEAAVVKAILESESQGWVETITLHAKWSLRVEVQAALLRKSQGESVQLLVAQGLDGIEVGSTHGGDHAADDADDSQNRSGDN